MAKKPYIELYPGKDGKWYFHKLNRNGKITEQSQGYTLKHNAKKAAKRDIPGLEVVVPEEES